MFATRVSRLGFYILCCLKQRRDNLTAGRPIICGTTANLEGWGSALPASGQQGIVEQAVIDISLLIFPKDISSLFSVHSHA